MLVSGARILAACGPWMAISAYSAVWSVTLASRPDARSCSAAATTPVFAAFGTTRYSAPASRYTMRSSRMPPSGAQIMVERRGCAGAGHRDLAHVREVEQPGSVPYRLVLGDLAAVPERHQPASERGHAGAQALVCRAQRCGPRRGAFCGAA